MESKSGHAGQQRKKGGQQKSLGQRVSVGETPADQCAASEGQGANAAEDAHLSPLDAGSLQCVAHDSQAEGDVGCTARAFQHAHGPSPVSGRRLTQPHVGGGQPQQTGRQQGLASPHPIGEPSPKIVTGQHRKHEGGQDQRDVGVGRAQGLQI